MSRQHRPLPAVLRPAIAGPPAPVRVLRHHEPRHLPAERHRQPPQLGHRLGTSIDLEPLKRDRDQLWAEAVHAYKAGEKWWLDDETEKLAAEVQEERRTTDVWEGPVLGYVAGQEWVQVADVLSNKLGLPVERHDQKAANRVASILKAAGWKQKSRRVGPDKWSRVYVPPEPDPRGTDGDDTRRARCGETVHGTVHGKAQETQVCERCERCERLYRESFGSREDDGDGEEDERDCAARIEFQASTAHTVHTVHSRGNAGFSRERCGAETVHGPTGQPRPFTAAKVGKAAARTSPRTTPSPRSSLCERRRRDPCRRGAALSRR